MTELWSCPDKWMLPYKTGSNWLHLRGKITKIGAALPRLLRPCRKCRTGIRSKSMSQFSITTWGTRPTNTPRNWLGQTKSSSEFPKLPIPQALQARLAHSVITPAAAWGQDITNKGPFTVARDERIRNFQMAAF